MSQEKEEATRIKAEKTREYQENVRKRLAEKHERDAIGLEQQNAAFEVSCLVTLGETSRHLQLFLRLSVRRKSHGRSEYRSSEIWSEMRCRVCGER